MARPVWVHRIVGLAALVLGSGTMLHSGVASFVPAAAEASALPTTPVPVTRRAVTALGRLEPRGRVIRLSGPSRAAVVIADLLVGEGDPVEEGQLIAVLDTFAAQRARVARLSAELASAARDLHRKDALFHDDIVSAAQVDACRTRVDLVRAQLREAQAELALSEVRSPIRGRVLAVHARDGERVGPKGMVELGRTGSMLAIAEVYETDVALLRPGQRAEISSPVLGGALRGTVERIGLKIGKQDVLGTDPAARSDARVVEVEIRLDDSARAGALTHLRVEVAILL